MKVLQLNRKSLFIITASVLIIALAGVGIVSFERVYEKTRLNRQLAATQSRLDGVRLEQLAAKQTELEEQLSQATAQFESVRAPFSESAGSTTTISTFLEIAKTHGLEVTEIKSPSPVAEKLGESTFWVVPLTARVKGDTPHLVSFLFELNSSLETAVIKSMTTTGDNYAEIELLVYTSRGD